MERGGHSFCDRLVLPLLLLLGCKKAEDKPTAAPPAPPARTPDAAPAPTASPEQAFRTGATDRAHLVFLDGTSLTVNEVEGERFSVTLIPHTLAVTTWGEARAGDSVNLEVDTMARYAARLAQAGA